jgi:hypothetical protein
MLSQKTNKLYVSLDGRSIDIEHLDITRYLSAPNRINTYKTYLGKVYGIFTDLSRMIYWYKHTASYNIATHWKSETAEIFGLEKGQVDKDEQGKLKIEVAVTRIVCKHPATVLSCYNINITLTQLHVPSVNTQLVSCHVII